ncbi:MAG: hypothetical protein ACRCXN_10700 [Bacteroidales bacterium]
MKYSIGFERDYEFYKANVENFNFCGTKTPMYKGIQSDDGFDSKQAFHIIESYGKTFDGYVKERTSDGNILNCIKCTESELLNKILLCKASVNFQIKEWANGIHDCTLTRRELDAIKTEFNCPDWVIEAVEKQYWKLIESNGFYKMMKI